MSSPPVPEVSENAAISRTHAVPFHSQIRTSGDTAPSNAPAGAGAGTMGGRKKKCEFPPLAPSLMERAGRTLGVAVGRSLSEHAAANNRMTAVIDRRQKRGII